MRFRQLYVIVSLFIAVVLAGCAGEKDTRVVIISTNDIHAQINHFPKFATFIKEKRAEYPNMILVDGGDRFSGNVYVDNAVEKGQPMILLMNKLGYEVAALGNHDFDYGQETLKKRIGEADFKIICGNIVSGESVLGQPDAYFMIEKAGIRFCFLSMIQIGGEERIPATNPGNLENITFRDFRDMIGETKSLKGECDVFIGLTHLGFQSDSVLAEAMPELDVIIGGHSHTLVSEPKVINGVLVTQSGSNLKYAGVTYLDFKGKELVRKTFTVVKLDSIGTPDGEVSRMVEEFSNRPEFKEKLGESASGMKSKEDVAALMADAICQAAGCDFAFCNSGGVRLNKIPAGDITRETVYKIEPFGNYIVTHELTLPEMKELVLNRFNGAKDPKIDLFVSDGRYTILTDGEGNGVDVVFVDKNGNKLKDNSKKYKVGLSNYVNSTYRFSGKEKGTDTGIVIVDAMTDFVKGKKEVSYDVKRTFIEKK